MKPVKFSFANPKFAIRIWHLHKDPLLIKGLNKSRILIITDAERIEKDNLTLNIFTPRSRSSTVVNRLSLCTGD